MFHFRLEALLTRRRHAEETLQCELTEARKALAAEQATLRESKSARNRCMRDMSRARQERFRAEEILLYYPYLERLAQAIDQQARRVGAAERQVSQKRLALIEAMKKRKILEKLREKQARDYRHEESAVEQRMHDEAAAQQYNRR